MINLALFAFTFLIKNIFKWYTFAISFMWGFFLCQIILGACGMTTLVDLIMK